MTLVRVRSKYQVTVPNALRHRVGLHVGDLLEARVERGKITFTPRSAIDRRIAQSMEDIKQGRAYGPFDSAGEMIRSLRENLKKGVADPAVRR
jgi:bifunctional DNA-binding transcriptional regulator/antitoxin component of YhaV-PrlF toxin-antitoxin module